MPILIIRRDLYANEVGATYIVYRSGYSGPSGETGEIVVGANQSKLDFLYAFFNGNNVNQSSQIRVYAKLGHHLYSSIDEISIS